MSKMNELKDLLGTMSYEEVESARDVVAEALGESVMEWYRCDVLLDVGEAVLVRAASPEAASTRALAHVLAGINMPDDATCDVEVARAEEVEAARQNGMTDMLDAE